MIKRSLLLLGIVGVLASIGAFTVWSQSDNVGKIAQPHAQQVAGETVSLKEFFGVGFRTDVPSNLVLRTGNDAVGQSLAQYLFGDSARHNGDQLAISVGTSSAPIILSETSLVKVRSIDPAHYSPVTYTWLPAGALAYSKNDSFEPTVFIQDNQNRYAAISVSGTGDHTQELLQSLETVVTRWSWQ